VNIDPDKLSEAIYKVMPKYYGIPVVPEFNRNLIGNIVRAVLAELESQSTPAVPAGSAYEQLEE
jgi:hypothetical protein